MPHSNYLINETSPYLLQHAHNPVDWYPWSPEPLKRAREENKPILVSIGYAACHWCHVMERESFEDETTAAYMNEHFINIKIDREERPDLDHIYMDAVQAMTGSGGWPLNVFLTPEAKPFYGGTYFPPRRAFNRSSWMETLEAVHLAFMQKRNEIDAQAENLTAHLLDANAIGQRKDVQATLSATQTNQIAQQILKMADRQWGGFGKAPKFPQTFSILWLLRYYYETKDQDSLDQALLSLDKMIAGGIYDQLGGGFARYATDEEWLAPHFEKMLYDNALLVSVLSEAYLLTSKPRYKEVIDETMEFIKRELLDKSNGFYAALDADSEGIEGRYYTWSQAEIMELLGNDAEVFLAYYDVSAKGNWHEGGDRPNILRVKKSMEAVATELKIPVELLANKLAEGRAQLLNHRSTRVRPLLDDKIILSWNALMNAAASKAFSATGNEAYRTLAIENMQFMLKEFFDEGQKRFLHTWKGGVAKYPAFLDDHALLIDALIGLQEITGDASWLIKAAELTDQVFAEFAAEESALFYYTPRYQDDVIVRKMEVYDGALPSGNSVMAYNLYRLGILFDKEEWKRHSEAMLDSVTTLATKYPTSFGNWACLLLEKVSGTVELVIAGARDEKMLGSVLAKYIPHRLLMQVSGVSGVSEVFPLTVGKPDRGEASLYLCSNYTCQAPVFSADMLISLIDRVKKG